MLKIIAGKYKGQLLAVPKNRDIRPTSNMVRESIFNTLYNKIENATVLDAFAGSGALGIEAISRGAKKVIACDINITTVKKNIEKLHIDNYELHKTNSFKTNFIEKFDIVFLDPPYKTKSEDIYRLIDNLSLSDGAIIIYEHDKNVEVVKSFKTKKYGNTIIDYIGEIQ